MVRRLLTLMACLAAAATCGRNPVSPDDIEPVLSAQEQTANITFRYSPGDRVDAAWQQRFHDAITSAFGIQLPARLKYYKYLTRAQMADLTGHDSTGFAEPDVFTVHSIYPSDGHEALHVYSARVGRPSNFFNEGLAVALNVDPADPSDVPRWNGTHVYEHTQLLIRMNQRLLLAAIVTTDGFRGAMEWVGYGEAGSFVLYLVEQYGLGCMLQFFGASTRDDSRSRIEANIQATWGLSLAQAESDWLAFVNAWGG